MAIITNFVDGSVVHEVRLGRVGTAQNILDFTKKNVLAGDVVQALKVDERYVVFEVTLEVLTPEGSAATATIGDESDPDGYEGSANLNGAANTLTGGTVEADAYSIGRSYQVEDTIDIIPSANLSNAKIRVTAFYYGKLKGPLVDASQPS